MMIFIESDGLFGTVVSTNVQLFKCHPTNYLFIN